MDDWMKNICSIPCICNGSAELTTVKKQFGDTVYDVKLYKCTTCGDTYMNSDHMDELRRIMRKNPLDLFNLED